MNFFCFNYSQKKIHTYLKSCLQLEGGWVWGSYGQYLQLDCFLFAQMAYLISLKKAMNYLIESQTHHLIIRSSASLDHSVGGDGWTMASQTEIYPKPANLVVVLFGKFSFCLWIPLSKAPSHNTNKVLTEISSLPLNKP